MGKEYTGDPEMAEKCQCFRTLLFYLVTSSIPDVSMFRQQLVKFPCHIIVYFYCVRIAADLTLPPAHRIHTITEFSPVRRHNIPYDMRRIFPVFFPGIRKCMKKLRRPIQIYPCGKLLEPSQSFCRTSQLLHAVSCCRLRSSQRGNKTFPELQCLCALCQKCSLPVPFLC